MIMREDINSTIYEKRRREKNLVLTLTWMMKCVSHDDDFFIFKKKPLAPRNDERVS